MKAHKQPLKEKSATKRLNRLLVNYQGCMKREMKGGNEVQYLYLEEIFDIRSTMTEISDSLQNISLDQKDDSVVNDTQKDSNQAYDNTNQNNNSDPDYSCDSRQQRKV